MVEIMDAVHADEIKGMYIMGENPAMSDPDLNHARGALAHLEHLVVQDLFLTETAVYADVVLPASAWPEKDGTVTNTNRQVQMGRQALPLPGETRHDLWIIQEIGAAHRLHWNYKHVSEVFTEMASMMPALDNISWDRVAREDARHLSGRCARTSPATTWCSTRASRAPAVSPSWWRRNYQPPDEMPDHGISVHSHHRARTRTLAHRRHDAARDGARRARAERSAPVSRGTIAKLGIAPGDMIRVTTRRGTVELNARQDDGIPDGVVFIPFAFVEAAANLLTNPALDPFGKIPEFKFCAAQGRGGRSGDAGRGGVDDVPRRRRNGPQWTMTTRTKRSSVSRRRSKSLRPGSRAAASSSSPRGSRWWPARSCSPRCCSDIVRSIRAMLMAAITALLAGIVVWGTNDCTAKEAAQELAAAEAERAALIGSIELRVVAANTTLH